MFVTANQINVDETEMCFLQMALIVFHTPGLQYFPTTLKGAVHP